MRTTFKDKTFLITGGTGSFGRVLAKKLLTNELCKKVIIFSRDEWKQWEMKETDPIFNHPKIRYFIGDVRDKDRLKRAFKDVDFVVHAAALKQVPAAEYNPSEFIRTNVDGAMNVIDAAIDRNVKKVIALSTDKAVNPINLYGATKLCSDKLFIAGNSYVGKNEFPQFSVVRYGNVLGSRGSIISLWKKMISLKTGYLPITSKEMTRFWITLDQAANFVLESFTHMEGGEIFIPKIPSMKIIDLADAIAPHFEKKIIGVRPGEKIHELLLSKEDAPYAYSYKSSYILFPKIHPKEEGLLKKHKLFSNLKKVDLSFSYASNTNDQWLSHEDFKKILD